MKQMGSFKQLQYWFLCHPDRVKGTIKSAERDKYRVTACSCSKSRKRAVVKEYEMTLPQLTEWLSSSQVRDGPETVLRIEKEK